MIRMTPPATVLVVDDEPVNLVVAEAALEPLGYDVVTVPDSASARSFMEASRPDLVLLDVMMRGESGIDVCRQWRSEGVWDDLPIVLLTALPAGERRTEGLAAGADDYFEKPFDVDALQRLVRRWVATGRRLRPHLDGHDGDALEAAMARAAQRPAREWAN